MIVNGDILSVLNFRGWLKTTKMKHLKINLFTQYTMVAWPALID